VPSPEMRVPVQRVAARAADMTFLFVADFMFYIISRWECWSMYGGRSATESTFVTLSGESCHSRLGFFHGAT
jgi:hypothetical protein